MNSAARDSPASFADVAEHPSPFQSRWPSFLPQNQIARYALAATFALAAATIGWILFSKQSQQPSEARNTVLVTLAPGVTRSAGETKVVQITPDVENVRLQLLLPEDEHSSYRVQLIGSERGDVLYRENLQPITSETNKLLDFTIPADITERDDYQLKLAGRTPSGEYEDVVTYYLRVLK